MSAADTLIALSRDPRFSPYATSAVPAWLWASSEQRLLWANASGAALLGAPTPAALAEQCYASDDPLAVEIARVAATLPPTGAPRLGQFQFGTHKLTCTCSRTALPGDAHGVLIIGSEPIRPALPLAERAARLFSPGSQPVAVFSADGKLLYATGDLDSETTLATLGADALKADAIAAGTATGASALGQLTLTRLGSGGTTVLVATLPSEEAEQQEDVAADAPPAAPVADIPAPPASEPAPPAEAPEKSERPLRFVWTMDAEARFHVTGEDFAAAMGPRTAQVLGRPWSEIAHALSLDPDGRVGKAIASRDTWSGVTLAWPSDVTGQGVTIELSGLPIFDRDRQFLGYRGFGICRDVARSRGDEARNETHQPPASAAPAAEAPAADAPEPRPLLTVVPASKNVVPFRATVAEKRPALTPVEHSAFREIAETLRSAPPVAPETVAPETATPETAAPEIAAPETAAPVSTPEPRQPAPLPSAFARSHAAPPQDDTDQTAILERLPVGVLIHRADQLIYANRAFLEWTGFADLAAVANAGGLERLVVEPGTGALDRTNGTGKTFTIATRAGDTLTCEGRLYSVPWKGENALMLVLIRTAADERHKASELAWHVAEAEARELKSILDTATDGVIVVDRDGSVLALNRSAEALFGYEYAEMVRRPFTELFAPESEHAARDYLDGLTKNGVASVLNDGREVIGRVRQGGLIPLFMTMGRVGDGANKFCAVLRDITQWKRAEEDLLNAKRTAERASSAKSDFLAKISHEIRTPLNAIIGFSEVMMEERFGAIGNERYREYMKDIHASGQHLVSLINDLLDLSKIEAGKLDLVFASVNLNELVRQCVALMQPQANQQRIIIRSSLSQTLPPVVADARSVRQIVLNLLSNSIKFTGAGGQVIVSTALTDRAEAILRVRDTGVGMTDKEIETAMEPFRQLQTSTRYGSGGTGLGLPLTKALAEANRAAFSIKSARDAGTLVEITFSGSRVLAE
jgi:PAS domain S-box-containing protein